MKTLCLVVIALMLMGCVTVAPYVDVTKTGKGYFSPTDPNEVSILGTVPKRPYEEIAMFSATGFLVKESAAMHNGIRAKVAPAGATAAIIMSEGYFLGDVPTRWANGVAIRWTDGAPPKAGAPAPLQPAPAPAPKVQPKRVGPGGSPNF